MCASCSGCWRQKQDAFSRLFEHDDRSKVRHAKTCSFPIQTLSSSTHPQTSSHHIGFVESYHDTPQRETSIFLKMAMVPVEHASNSYATSRCDHRYISKAENKTPAPRYPTRSMKPYLQSIPIESKAAVTIIAASRQKEIPKTANNIEAKRGEFFLSSPFVNARGERRDSQNKHQRNL